MNSSETKDMVVCREKTVSRSTEKNKRREEIDEFDPNNDELAGTMTAMPNRHAPVQVAGASREDPEHTEEVWGRSSAGRVIPAKGGNPGT